VIPSKFRDYLMAQGAATTAHSGHSLWDHLCGVHRILLACGSEDYVCKAGLFHSIYGTRAFKMVSVDGSRRAEVQELIGSRAEYLVWVFCNLPRPHLFESSLKQQSFDWLAGLGANNTKRLSEELVRLECANLLEQKSLHEFPFLARHAQAIGMLNREGFPV
jgi:hypothetical protein